MTSSIRMQKLDCYQVAKTIAVRVHEARIGDAELRDQATRAAKSTFLQLAEGLPNEGAGMRRKYFVTANNSLHEVVAAVDLAAAIGAIEQAVADEIHRLELAAQADDSRAPPLAGDAPRTAPAASIATDASRIATAIALSGVGTPNRSPSRTMTPFRASISSGRSARRSTSIELA